MILVNVEADACKRKEVDTCIASHVQPLGGSSLPGSNEKGTGKSRGPTDLTNTRISHSGSKAQHEGDTRNHAV